MWDIVLNLKMVFYLEKNVKLIDIANRIDTRLEENESQEIINNYSTTLNLLDNYDHDRVIKNTGTL